MFKQALSLAVLSTVASVASISYAGSAHALNVTAIPGVSAGLTAGSFDPNYNASNYITQNYNSPNYTGTTPTLPNIAGLQYIFSTPNDSYSTTAGSHLTGIYSDQWAPSNPDGTSNKSNYLAVFDNNGSQDVTNSYSNGSVQTNQGSVIIKSTATLNDISVDLGALSTGNQISFINTNTNTVVASYNYTDLNKLAPVANAAQGNQLNGLFQFSSTGNNDNFNEIVFTQLDTSGGFESDNLTVHTGTGAYTSSVPEPGVVLGLVGVGAMFLSKRKSQKIV